MYCETDKELICMKCHLVGKHKDHSVKDVVEVFAGIREELTVSLMGERPLDQKL